MSLRDRGVVAAPASDLCCFQYNGRALSLSVREVDTFDDQEAEQGTSLVLETVTGARSLQEPNIH